MALYVNAAIQSLKALDPRCHTPTQTFISHWATESQFSFLGSLPPGWKHFVVCMKLVRIGSQFFPCFSLFFINSGISGRQATLFESL